MSVWAVPVFLILAAALAACDWQRRAVPRAVVLVGAALGAYFSPPTTWSVLLTVMLGIVAGFMVALAAGLPSGDAAVGGMLGAWLGVELTLVVWSVALAWALLVWTLWEARRIDWPGEWPFTPFLLLPACVVLIGKGMG